MDYEANALCLICGSTKQKILGRRGNREFINAPETHKHLSTNIVQCYDCSFIFCNPSILSSETLEKEHYDNPITYLASQNSNIEHPYLNGFATIYKYKQGGKLLDVGAGKGEFLFFAKRKGFLVSGFEPSPHFCEYATKNFDLELVCGDLNDFKKTNVGLSSFDVITLFHVLEHVKNPAEILIGLLPLLSKDGVAYIEVPNADATLLRFVDVFYRIMRKGWSSRLSPVHPPFHSIGYTKESLRRILKDTGFEIVEIRTFTGKNRGHQIGERFKGFLAFIRSVVVEIIGFLPNKEIIGAVVRSIS